MLFAFRIIKPAGGRIEALLKAAFPWHDAMFLADVPFADHGGEVTRATHHFAHGDAGVIETTAITWQVVVLCHVADARFMRIEAGEQRGAAGTATAGVVELGEPQAGRRELVEVRRRNFASVTTDIGEAHVINQDDNDVRPGWRRGE